MKMKLINSIFKTFVLSVLVVAQVHFAYAQTASILPPAKTTFVDQNGKPLTSGTVDFYIPSTTTRKTTWQDSAETVPNTNPVVLDAAGRAIVLGSGSYRQVVKDRNGNTIWDQVTSSTGSGSSTSTATGDGDLVGTIKPWAGMTAPNQYLFTYGQEVSRVTYASLYTAITSTQPVFCNSGSAVLTGLSDTSNFWVGMSLEVSCIAAGNTTILSKTVSTVTMAVNANVTVNTNAVFYPWGRGNGTTTFNIPDLRGYVLAGNTGMGGVTSSTLTAANFGSAGPNSSGAAGGSQNHTWTAAEVPGHNHAVFLNDPGHTHTNFGGATFVGGGGDAGNAGLTGGGANYTLATRTASNTTGTTIRDTSGLFGTTNQTNPTGGGIAVSATLGNTGSGYTNGTQTLTLTGGTCSVQPQFSVLVAGNVLTGTPSLVTAGSCTIAPANPASSTGGGGSSGTLNVTYSAQPVPLVQPTRTTNYIIKVTPDQNSATASGVTSLGLMTGDIACGASLTCTGNTISFGGSPISLANGGTNNALTASNGGVVYSDATKLNILAGTATPNLCLLSGNLAAPTWGSCAGGATVSSIAGNTGAFTVAAGVTNSTNQIQSDPAYSGFALQNCTLSASVGSNLLTVSLKDNAGNAPSTTSPCNINYRNVTAATGSTTSVPQTSALTIDTNSTSATMGTANNVPFRFWVVVFNNAGTNVLALINASNTTQIFPVNDGSISTSVAMSAAATSAGVFYTPNGTTVTSKAYRILGYLEYSAGVTTAGTYGIVPTVIQAYGAGIYKPGDIVQTAYTRNATSQTTANTYTVSNTAPTSANGAVFAAAPSVTPSSPVNHIRIQGQIAIGGSGLNMWAGLADGTTILATTYTTTPTNGYATIPLFFETSNVSVAKTYNLYAGGSATINVNGITGGGAALGGTAATYIKVEEIMG